MDSNVEVMSVTIQNTSDRARTIVPIAAIPIFGRSADNLRDHRNVTSMLHRISTIPEGVLVKPTMSFDEKGHRENHKTYFVLGFDKNGGTPESFYPTVDAFLGEGGTFLKPRSVYDDEPGCGAGQGWFNSYYDNHKRAAESYNEDDDKTRMMLTGQVFAIMGKVATNEQIEKITRAADRYLYKGKIGGYRLNTDFHEFKNDMGRMFGFAYGRGKYPYLTGAASWYLLTMITEVFGVRGVAGDLTVTPALLKKQFDERGCAGISLNFAGKRFDITIENKELKEVGEYKITCASLNGSQIPVSEAGLVISREQITGLGELNKLVINIG